MTSKFIGFVVIYANDPAYKGTDAFLLVDDRRRGTAKHCYSLETATVFDTQAEAERWAGSHPQLLGKGHCLPDVRPVWQETKLTMVDPRGASVRLKEDTQLRQGLDAAARRFR